MSTPASISRRVRHFSAPGPLRALILGVGLLFGPQVWAQSAVPAVAVEQQELQVNINEADAELIADILVGVGPSRAQAIVEYREQHGRFESLDDLLAVSGVGESTIHNNQERIAFE